MTRAVVPELVAMLEAAKRLAGVVHDAESELASA